uniref:Secreted protein n=1 Tax=Riptortus pedestris TaxID=329032 RepID=R4WCR4_RIPPE|nr:unknown secreted protein [Riptortus pedestris]
MWKSMRVLALFCFASSTAGEPYIENLNSYIDETLDDLNEYFTQEGQGQITINSTSLYDLELNEGSIIGWNSFKRTKFCSSSTFDNGSFILDFHYGLKLAVVTFNKVIHQGNVSTLTLISEINSFHKRVFIDPQSCQIDIPVYGIELLHSTIHQFPREADFLIVSLIEGINEKLEPFKLELQQSLYDVCRNATPPSELQAPFMNAIFGYVSQLIN